MLLLLILLLLLLLLLLMLLLILRLLGVVVQDWVGDGVVLAEILGEDVVQVDIVVGVLEFVFYSRGRDRRRRDTRKRDVKNRVFRWRLQRDDRTLQYPLREKHIDSDQPLFMRWHIPAGSPR